jgi:uncharacterized protein
MPKTESRDATHEDLRSGGRACPICGKPSIAKMRPFCSSRCADIDLHHWLSGRYALPAAPDEDALAQADEEQLG